MKRNVLFLKAFLRLFLFLSSISLIFTTCKRQNDHNTGIPSRTEKGDAEFITWKKTIIDSSGLSMQTRTSTATLPPPKCYLNGSVGTYGVTRTGSCGTGYSYTLRLDDIDFSGSAATVNPPSVRINGIAFRPTLVTTTAGIVHYSLSAPYTSFGVADADYCATDSVTVTLGVCSLLGRGNTITEVLKLTPSEACGSTNPDITSTSAHYSYPPTTMTLPRAGGVDLGLLVNLCNTCTVRYPDFYVFQYRLSGTSTWTPVTVAYPTYLFYSLSLPSGTYDLQGNNSCAPGSNVPNDGPVVSGSPSTFTVL